MSKRSSPSTTSRLLALVMGPGYLFLVAHGLSNATQTRLAVALAVTILAALTVMAVLTLLGVKACDYKQSAIRFTLSTAFLLSVPLCIYLATLRSVLRSLPTQDVDWLLWTLIAALAILWMSLTTVVLLRLAEAIMWLAVVLRRRLSTKGTRKGSPRVRNQAVQPSGDQAAG